MKLFSGFSTRFLLKKMLFLSVMLLFLAQNSSAQCTGTDCTATLNTNSNNYSFITGTTCVDGTVTLENAVTFVSGTSVCIKAGSTLNLNNVNNFYFPATGDVTFNVYGVLNINGNPTFGGNIHFVVHSGGSLTSSGTVKFDGATSSLTNNGTVTVPNIELSNGKTVTIDNNSTMTVNGNMNLASGTAYVRNQSNLIVTSNYSTSATSVYVNCGSYTGQFNLGGGKVINTGTFTSSQIDMGGSTARFENYNKVILTGNLNMGGLGSVFYNQGIVDASTGGGHIQSDGNLTGPLLTGTGYFKLRVKTTMNNGSVGPNLNFQLGSTTVTKPDVFVNNIIEVAPVTYLASTPISISPSTDCPNTDGSPSTPVPTTSTACAGIDLTTLQPSYTNVTYEWFTGTSATRGTQVTSLTTPKVTCYTTIGTVYLWAKSNGSTLYSPTGAAVTITDCATAWKTIKTTGDWADTDMWKYRDASGAWITIASPPYNTKPVYISNGTTVTIPSSITTINSDSLVIESLGKLVVSNPITINSPLVFEIDKDGNAGQLLGACGNVTMSGSSKLIARKTLDNTWDFISFPFEVTSGRIYLAKTATAADWGDLSSDIVDGKEFIVAEYDAEKRADGGAALASNSTYFKSVSPHTFTAQKGYIITGGAGLNTGETITLDFVSVDGASLSFCDKITAAGDLSYVTGTKCNNAWGWNLVGTPYTAAYNLYYASTSANPALKPYYVWNGSTYTVITTNGTTLDYPLNPFSAFFLQTTAANQTLNYDDAGLTNLTSHTVGSSSAPALKASILLSQNTTKDLTTINLEENAATEYIKGEDVVKMSNSSSLAPQIYTEAIGACSPLNINSLPLNTQRIDLKIKLGKLGTNVIQLVDLENARDFNTVVLVDTESGISTDLLKDSYTFENVATGENSRFYILLSQTNGTGINDLTNNNVKAIVQGNNVQLRGLEGKARVNIYDVVGKRISVFQSVNNLETVHIAKSGIYFINILTEKQNSTAKVIIE